MSNEAVKNTDGVPIWCWEWLRCKWHTLSGLLTTQLVKDILQVLNLQVIIFVSALKRRYK